MSSATSADRLADYLAGRVTAEQLVVAVTAEYYKGDERREMLRPVMDVIERAHPGIVELASSDQRPGFAVRLAERPFPKRFEGELRDAAAAVMSVSASPVLSVPPAPVRRPGLLARVMNAIRRVLRG
jgi:hypothetical protein